MNSRSVKHSAAARQSGSTAASKRKTTSIVVPPELPPPADKVAAEYVKRQRDEDRYRFLDQIETARQIARKYPELLSGPLPKQLLRSFHRHLSRNGFRARFLGSRINDECLTVGYERRLLKRSKGALQQGL